MKKLFYYSREEGTEQKLDQMRKNTAINAVGFGIDHCLLNTSGLLTSSDYAALPSQRDSIRSAYALIESNGGTVLSSTTHDASKPKDFLVITKAYFDLDKLEYSKAIDLTVQPDYKAVVEISLITGLHPIMFELFENNNLINEAVEQYTAQENYDPEKVIPQALASQGFKRMSVRALPNQPLADIHWFVNYKQHYVGVVISGYDVVPAIEKASNQKSNFKKISVYKNKTSVKSS